LSIHPIFFCSLFSVLSISSRLKMFAAIYIPDFPVEAVIRAHPELRDHAVAVIEGIPPLAYVVALNDRARELGMRIAMTRMQAEVFATALEPRKSPPPESRTSSTRKNDEGDPRFKLVRDPIHMHNAQENAWLPRPRRPKHSSQDVKLSLALRSQQQEIAAHAALLDTAYGFSPRVEDTAADTVLLDLDGLERLFGSPQKIARDIARRAAELGLEANVAVAANPDNAIHAARGFTGVTMIPFGHEAERLGTLPLSVLFAAELNRPAPSRRRTEARDREKRFAHMHETLDRWGIRNFRALAALPPVSLSERLGAEGVRLQKLANGETTRELLLAESALEFHEALELEYPVELIEPLAFLLGRMLEQLCARLAARALSTNELRLKLQLEHRAGDETTVGTDELDNARKFVDRKLTLPVAMNDPRLFLKLLHLELNGNPPGGPVTKMWLSAEPSRPRIAQSGLFVPLAPEPEKLQLTLARIQRVLGAAPSAELRAGSPELLDTHQPDAFRMKRFQPRDPESKDSKQTMEPKASANNKTAHDERPPTALPTTAFRTLRPALAAQVWLREGRPVRLACDPIGAGRTTENVLWAAGPWRTSGNWWVFPEDAPAQPSTDAPQVWHREQWDLALASAKLDANSSNPETHVALYRVSHDLLSQEWFVEGSYD
jgi:protein ImuB